MTASIKRPGAASIVLVGETGTGKTAQFLTLPGPPERKFVQAFDPGANDTLQDEVPIEWWLARGDLEMAGKTVVKSGKGQKLDKKTTLDGPNLFNEWATDFNAKLSSGFFDNVDYYMLDSATMMAWHALQRVRFLQEEQGRDDERTDYRIAGELITNAMLSVLSLPCTVIVTVHTKYQEDKSTGTKNKTFSLPGGATIYMPRGAGVVWGTEQLPQGKEKRPRFGLVTQQNRNHPMVKNSRRFEDLPSLIDVTVDDWARAPEYGIGAILEGIKQVPYVAPRPERS